MKSVVTAFGFVAVCLASLLVSAAAQTPATTKVRFDQVVASVKDPNGILVGNLSAKDFVIEEDGVKQTLVGFGEGADAPMSLAVLIDINEDMNNYLGTAKGAAVQVLFKTLTTRDEFALYSFDSDLHILQDFIPATPDNAVKIQDTLKDLKAKGPTTFLYNVVSDTVATMKNAKNSRRALVVITEARDRDAGGIGALKNAAAQYGVSVYAIGIGGTLPSTKEAADLAAGAFNSIRTNTSGLRDVGLQDVSGGLQNRGFGGGGFGGGGFGGGGLGGGGFGGGGLGGGGLGGGGFGGPGFGGGGLGNPGFGGGGFNNNGFGGGGLGNPGFGGGGFNNNGFGGGGFNNNTPGFGGFNDNNGIGGFNNPGGRPAGGPGGPGGFGGFGMMGSSVVLQNMVNAATGRLGVINLSTFETTAGANDTWQNITGMAQAISQDLRAEYTIGYYTTKPGSYQDRKLTVKSVHEELTVSIGPPRPPEPIAVAPAPAPEAAKAADGKDKDKNDKTKDKDKKSKK
ncbi:MAG TPA: hypothetical protein VFY29_04540 [Terriglobia bacterium]|nr:hypothetical protein [Terriglobia bacterium]